MRKGTIIVKTSTMWLTRREKGMKEIRQGLSVKERSNVGEQTKRRGGSSWEERRKEEGQSKKKTEQRIKQKWAGPVLGALCVTEIFVALCGKYDFLLLRGKGKLG